MSQILDDKLAVLLKHVPALRDQGITKLKIDGIEVELRAAPQPEPTSTQEVAPGRDPMTFNLPPGMKLPSLRDRR